MGQYLAIGLRLKVAMNKKDLDNRQDGVTSDDVFSRIEKKCNLNEIYEKTEKENYFVYSLKEDILDKELIPFLRKFYSLRYPNDTDYGTARVIEELEKIQDTSSRLTILRERRYPTYQDGDEFDYYEIKGLWDSVRISCSNAILSLDGKIIMECYGDVFAFFRRCIISQMSEFKLAQALSVWIDG